MRALGIILAGGNNNKMRELSNKRAVVPWNGRRDQSEPDMAEKQP